MKYIKHLLLAFVSIQLIGCGDIEELSDFDLEPRSVEQVEDGFTSNREGQAPINVVYFVPSNVAVPSDETLSNYGKSVIFSQRWYEKQMELFGYGKKTFALFTNEEDTEARVLVIRGSKTTSEYNDDVGNIVPEIKAYFDANPGLVGGLDAVVATDEALGFNVVQAGSLENGKYGFVRSNDNWNYRDSEKDLDGLDLFTAGRIQAILHELGHVFGSPHFAHKASDLPNVNVMGGGYGAGYWDSGNQDKVFIMEELAAFANTSRPFNPADNNVDYSQQPNVQMVSYDIKKNAEKEATEFDIVFTSDMNPVRVYVGYDAYPVGGNQGYDRVPFGTNDITATGNDNEYSVHIEAPYAEFFNGNVDDSKTEVKLDVTAIVDNGKRGDIVGYDYTITNAPVPDDNINKSGNASDFQLSDRSGWTVTTNSFSGNEGQEAEVIIDSDLATYWQSKFPYNLQNDGPHVIDFDMGTFMEFEGIYINADRSEDRKFYPEDVKVEISINGETYTEVKSETLPNLGENQILFDAPVTAKFIRLTVSSINATNGVPNLNLAEVDIINGMETDAPDVGSTFDLSDRSGWSVTTNTFSGSDAQTEANKIIDSDLSTYWQSKFPYVFGNDGPHVIDFDMGTFMEFEGIYINADRSEDRKFYPEDIKIEISNDGTTYTEVTSKTLPNQGEHLVEFDSPVVARYIKLTVTSINATNGVPNLNLAEVDLINGVETDEPGQEFSLSDRSAWTVTTNSSAPADDQQPGSMIDSDLDTFWQSAFPYRFTEREPHQINVDMGSSQDFDGIYINANRDNDRLFLPKQIRIQTSTDGTTYVDAVDVSVDDSGEHLIEFSNSVSAQYFRVFVSEVYTPNGVDNLHITELDIIQ